MNLKYCVLDLETTGLDTSTCDILEACVYDLYTGDSFNEFYYTSKSEEECEKAIQVNKLTPLVIEQKRWNSTAPHFFREHVDYWQEAINQYDVIIGHCAKFDTDILKNHGLFLDNHKIICTQSLMQKLNPKKGWWSLKNCIELFEIEYDSEKAHGALYDCKLTARLFQRQSYLMSLKEFNLYP